MHVKIEYAAYRMQHNTQQYSAADGTWRLHAYINMNMYDNTINVW